MFISYARADRPKVAPIAAALTATGHDVWWDALIDGGAAFAKMIEDQLNAADVVVAIWSATSVESDWVRDEAAHGRDRKSLVPVSLDGTPPPLGFRQYHAVDMSGWRGGTDEAQLQSLVRGIAGVGTPGLARSAFAPVSQGIPRRTVLLGGGVAAAAIAGGLLIFKPFGASAATNSVAVLPFANLSGDPAQSYFSDGLSEEVRGALARNERLKVAAPTSSNKFRARDDDAKAIGQKLDVAYLLMGSVRRSGNAVRITSELIDAPSGFSKWSQTFDRQMTDIFAVQSEIARTVASALDIEVAAQAPAKAPGSTGNVAAYEAYLRGKALFELSADEASDRAALAQFDAAIAADPNYAAARAARSRTLTGMANQYAKGNQLQSMYNDSISEAKRAVALAPDFADAQSALGYVLFYGKVDVRGARAAFERSRALGKGDADVLSRYAQYAARIGRFDDATTASDQVIGLDPLNPRAFRTRASILYAQRRYADSIPPGEKALSLNPKLGVAHAAIGDALFWMGKPQESLVAYRAEPSAIFRLTGIAIAARRVGERLVAEAALAELVAHNGDAAAYQQAQVLAQWGKPEAALDMLGRARAVGDGGLTYIRNDPMLDVLRKTKRFSDLLIEVGFG